MTLQERNGLAINNPDAGEKTIFVDSADSKLKTKNENGLVETLATGVSIPTGGTTGQVLAKASDTDGDVEWASAGSSGPLVYKALVSQSGTNAPTAIVLQNTLGGTPVWSRFFPGVYRLTLVNAFTGNTNMPLNAEDGYYGNFFPVPSANLETDPITIDAGRGYSILKLSNSEIQLKSNSSNNVASDSILSQTLVNIEVYP